MRTTLAAVLALFAMAHVLCALGADMYPVTDADKKILSEIVGALQRKDSTWIADHMIYPLSVVVSNRTRSVRSKEQFLPILRRELTDSRRAKILELAKEPLFKNWRGTMLGNGHLWFTQYHLPGGKAGTYGILAIGHFAFQPKESVKPRAAANHPVAANSASTPFGRVGDHRGGVAGRDR